MLDLNFKDDVFSGERRYSLKNNSDNTVSLTDVTDYTQEGTYISALVLNQMVAEINEKLGSENASDFLKSEKYFDGNTPTDLNTLWETGFYSGAAFTNVAPGVLDGQGNVLVFQYNSDENTSGWTRQMFISAHTSEVFVRNSNDGVWGEWVRLLNSEDETVFQHRDLITTLTYDIKDGTYYVDNSTNGSFPYNWGVLSVFGGKWSREKTLIFISTGNNNRMYVNTMVDTNGLGAMAFTGWRDMTNFAPSGYGLGTYNANISGNNLNDYKLTGFYMGDRLTNAPNENWWYVQVMGHNDVYATQTATSLNSGADNVAVYVRKMEGGTWGRWHKVQDDIGFHERITLTSGKIIDAIISKANEGYKGGYFVLSGFTPSDTYASNSWGLIEWKRADVTIYSMEFYVDRTTLTARRSVTPSEGIDTGWRECWTSQHTNRVAIQSSTPASASDTLWVW